MADMMRAYQLLGAGKAEVVEIPVPEPGPGQVRLKMAAAGLCHSDLLVIHADPPFFPIPSIIGHETTGWADKLGEGVTGIEIGAAYGIYFPWGCGHCAPCAKGAENVCEKAPMVPGFGCGVDGGMAEYVIVSDPRHLIPLGKLDPVAAAPLMCAGITTYHAVDKAKALLGAGSSAVIIGVGGLGHLAIQILKALTPARIIAVDRHQEKLDHAKALGADEGLIAGEGATAAIREMTGGLGAALVIDLVGNDATLGFAQSVLAMGGQLQVVGVGGGTLPLRFHEMPRDASVSVPYAGSTPDLRDVVRLAQDGHVHADVVRIGFADIAATYREMDEGRLQGRAVLVPTIS
ncbi:NAD(P)-dependent alcohol dehydrogenase [Sphingomonas sp. AOB5]|uniref:NAD(P)-dependent alcohol dehydrogenase n=1 Tax=Sphingomonas sp. AOB5 TaxID=3034017 RepID=UPI0023F6483B|nr:NAD(P)-dependent alcohol dehydrogenase [Sphingomonas sp. AOB5]MDF7776721.1 NAD(P)-dependent alcohol dehydrogenase [Sphingomonas sp. AOB5]